MYDAILKALYSLNNLNSDAERAAYLRSLKPVARSLRSSFNPYAAPHVKVDYRSRDVQSAYMLRYFPQYSQIIRLVLNRLMNRRIKLPFDHEEISASFFGAGPAPEVYGFLQFLNAGFRNIRKVSAKTFDVISNEWAYARAITINHLIPSMWQHSVELNASNFDLSQTASAENLAQTINSSSMLVFQNCLNEISQNLYPNVVENINSLVYAMRPESILMIIDLSSYPAALELIERIENSVRSQQPVTVLIGLHEGERIYDAIVFRNMLPPMITQNLLTGEDGLIPRRKIKYRCLVIRKD
ncbi:MAG: hypothetical protein JOZ96_05780 [Acidobacteria bacterium]|nr:hypothetical protein [Acidobacteriota bacterium]